MADAGMGQWASEEGDVLHPGELDVGDEARPAFQMAVILQARKRRADTLS